MVKAPVHNTHTRTALKKRNDTAADDLQKQVVLEKKIREEKKKQWAEEKQAEEEKKKKTDQEKAKANAVTVTVSPPNINKDETMIISIDKEEGAETIVTQMTDDCTYAKDAEALVRHGISPNHLFGKETKGATGTKKGRTSEGS